MSSKSPSTHLQLGSKYCFQFLYIAGLCSNFFGRSIFALANCYALNININKITVRTQEKNCQFENFIFSCFS